MHVIHETFLLLLHLSVQSLPPAFGLALLLLSRQFLTLQFSFQAGGFPAQLLHELVSAGELMLQLGNFTSRKLQLLLQRVHLLLEVLLVLGGSKVGFLRSHHAFQLCDLGLLRLHQALRVQHVLPQLSQHLSILVLHFLCHLISDFSHLSFDDHGMVPELLKKSCSCPLQMCLELLLNVLKSASLPKVLHLLGIQLHLLCGKSLEDFVQTGA
mmetsp:Transcript_69477/g.96584  ORF Transcript_69477/g.96584 Transcript_69477/m.96584 type:complete len:212 (+) Transcript_69477:579-1214(+)